MLNEIPIIAIINNETFRFIVISRLPTPIAISKKNDGVMKIRYLLINIGTQIDEINIMRSGVKNHIRRIL
jgi:hypothetical protein